LGNTDSYGSGRKNDNDSSYGTSGSGGYGTSSRDDNDTYGSSKDKNDAYGSSKQDNDSYGSSSGGYGSRDDDNRRGGDSTAGRLMEKAGELLGSNRLADQGREKREGQGYGNDDN
jgi:hypothetical protein